MRRDGSSPGLLAGVAAVAVLVGGAAHLAAAPDPATPAASPEASLVRQLAAEADSIERAEAIVHDKLVAAEDVRHRRLRAAYRVLRAATGSDAMAAARRRAAARLLVERDAFERTLLVDEASQLRAARERVAGEIATLPHIDLPANLARPAPGKIARPFGSLTHERSKATLARRGVDIEVEERSAVISPAAGTVRYAGPIRGLDQGVILDHGSYVTVIAKLGELALPVGAPIAAGDRIGRAARYRVYLEVRLKLGPGGLPIDPEAVLAKPR